VVGRRLCGVGRKCRVRGGLQLAAQRSFLVDGDGARAAWWHTWGQIARCALLPEPACDTALTDLKQIDKLATGHTTRVGGEDALAQIG
jgi:hypothetical protein